ncbi:hypothetical protein PHIM7_248 [Sinorhizobium phage phiM7]|uniref:Uncharacterized protein n=2 Tax=Emdodecavirus TaxID=1980937 RepID=A0A0F6WCZ0_9CAUD|nr:hypothetical protein AVT40_gp279 [Sinorhizobium phage phiN3]YP_009601373.1 hypothetical protein FDH46_gp230 [Sinorhizobium phage phiM7]AKF12793.1 hypothetical protein PHIM7_248 [Sinorhizobium phage phiM7]AKF13154.1 hypothetical protein PHIM19_249 [Sinorhizobium phage phiM19]AKF13517.1 hypothetical protein PHIN3_254 [Sinorhizobium phage phiN3]
MSGPKFVVYVQPTDTTDFFVPVGYWTTTGVMDETAGEVISEINKLIQAEADAWYDFFKTNPDRARRHVMEWGGATFPIIATN